MQMPTLETDHWQLGSGEEMNRQYPDTFWIPPLEMRQNLQVGQAAKLIFQIEVINENGKIEIKRERMWVLVSECHDDGYIGILANQPVWVDASEDFYLTFRAEIPFRPEHIIDIGEETYSEADLEEFLPPSRQWHC